MALTRVGSGRGPGGHGHAGAVWEDDATGLIFRYNGSMTTNVFAKRGGHFQEVTVLTSEGPHPTLAEVRGHIVRWLRENKREIDLGHYRRRRGQERSRWAQPLTRNEKIGVGVLAAVGAIAVIKSLP